MSIETLADKYLSEYLSNKEKIRQGEKPFRGEGLILEELVYELTGWQWNNTKDMVDFSIEGKPVDLKATGYDSPEVFIEVIQNMRKRNISAHWTHGWDLVYFWTSKEHWGKMAYIDIKALEQYVIENKVPMVFGGYTAWGYKLDIRDLINAGVAHPKGRMTYNPWSRT